MLVDDAGGSSYVGPFPRGPGWTRTDLDADLWGDEGLAARMVSTTGLQRWGEAEEVVGPTVFLASDASSSVAGQALALDGGETAG